MKVSVNIKTEGHPDGFKWSSTLKFKTHAKEMVSEITEIKDNQTALANAVKTSLDSIKGSCTVDVFTTSVGSPDEVKKFLNTANEIKKAYPHHIIKFYAS